MLITAGWLYFHDYILPTLFLNCEPTQMNKPISIHGWVVLPFSSPSTIYSIPCDTGVIDSIELRTVTQMEVFSRRSRKMVFSGAFAKVRKATINCMSLPPPGRNNSTPTGRILIKFDIWTVFKNLSRELSCNQNPTRITGTLHEDVFTFTRGSQ